MASGRFLSTSIAEDERLGKLSITAELIYIKTIPHLDRDGMISGKPGLLWAKVCPLREELFGNTQAIIDEWVALELVIRFATSEGPVLFFPGFAKNNNLPHYERERPSRFPAPPGYTRTDKGLTESQQVQELVQESVQEFPLQDQEEDKDQEKREATAWPSKPAPHPAVIVFREVWQRNPNKPQMKTISERITDLELWREACQAWGDKGHKPTNVDGMLDWYDHPERFRTAYRPPPNGGDYRSTNNGVNAIMDYVQRKGLLHE